MINYLFKSYCHLRPAYRELLNHHIHISEQDLVKDITEEEKTSIVLTRSANGSFVMCEKARIFETLA